MKKILALILVVCLSVGCFVACGEEEPAATKNPTAAPATTAPADDNTTDESAAPDVTDVLAETTEPDESAAPESEDPAPTEDNGDEPAGDWEMPDNSAIDCYAYDFRGGDSSYMEYLEGYSYLLTGSQSANDVYLEATDPEGAKPGYLTAYVDGDGVANDPYFYFYTNSERPDELPIDFNLQDYPILKVVIKNNTPDTGFEMFLWEFGTNLTADHCLTFSGISSNDTEFKTYYIDLRSSGASNTLSVSGSIDNRLVSAFRFDAPSANGATDPSMDIQYLGFFKTLDDAKAYK